LLAGALVDELLLMVFPVLVGGGFGLFPDDRKKMPLELTHVEAYDSGVLLQVDRPVEGGAP
jgi:riboflavin biosynthesis pyrimidine reductase